MSHLERIATLQQAAFAPRQAAFLAHVAVHGGYFLRRQFVAFTGHPDGGTTTALLRRLRRQGLVSWGLYGRGTHLYRLDERAFGGLLSLARRRCRQRASTGMVVRRLMALDVVLAFADARLLATPDDKIEYFTGERDVPVDACPATWHPARAPGEEAEHRVFADAVPVAVEPEQDRVSFLYVQGPATTLTGWTTFLDRYGQLLSVLPTARVVFCTVDVSGFERGVRATFGRWQQTAGGRQADVSRRLRVVAEDYFRARDDAAKYCVSSLSGTARALLRTGSRRFRAARYSSMSADWSRAGRAGLDDYFAAQIAVRVDHVELAFHRVAHRYDVFGTATARALRAPEGPRKGRIQAIDSALVAAG